MKAEFTTSLPN